MGERAANEEKSNGGPSADGGRLQYKRQFLRRQFAAVIIFSASENNHQRRAERKRDAISRWRRATGLFLKFVRRRRRERRKKNTKEKIFPKHWHSFPVDASKFEWAHGVAASNGARKALWPAQRQRTAKMDTKFIVERQLAGTA